MRKQKYYPCVCDLTTLQFERVMGASKRTKEEKAVHEYLQELEAAIRSIISTLPHFSFDVIKNKYQAHLNKEDQETSATSTQTSVYDLFDIIIAKSEKEGRSGNADVITCAKNSIQKFREKLEFKDINIQFLEEYESWFLKRGFSLTTLGIYLRELRHVYNTAISNDYRLITRDFYPFNNIDNPRGYRIPSGSKIKKSTEQTTDQKDCRVSSPGK